MSPRARLLLVALVLGPLLLGVLPGPLLPGPLAPGPSASTAQAAAAAAPAAAAPAAPPAAPADPTAPPADPTADPTGQPAPGPTLAPDPAPVPQPTAGVVSDPPTTAPGTRPVPRPTTRTPAPAPALPTALPTASSTQVPPGAGGVRLDVTALGPAVLRPDGRITMRGRVTNDGPTALEDLEVRMFGWSPRLSSRDAVDSWAENRTPVRAGDRLVAITEIDRLDPGRTVEVALDAPAETLGLPARASSWGPRGLTVDVVDDAYSQLAVQRGFTVWDPRDDAADQDRTTVSLLAPLTAGPPDVTDALVPEDLMRSLTSDGGRLSRVVEVTERTSAAWAVDPAVLQSAARLTGDVEGSGADGEGQPAPEPTATATGTATREPGTGEPTPGDDAQAGPEGWLDRARSAAQGRDLLALPRSDPDLLGLAHAGAGELYQLAARQGRGAVSDLLDRPTLTEVAWPAAGGADDAGLTVASEAGATAVVLAAGAQPPLDEGTLTPTGRSTVRVGGARLDGLLVDSRLSSTLTAATQGTGPALATSRLLAETAAVTGAATRAGEEPPHLLLALPRDWDPQPRSAARTFDALAAAPWLREAPLDDLLDAAPDDVERAPVGLSDTSGSVELPAEGVRTAAAALASVRDMASALTRPERVLDPAEDSAVAAVSASWLTDPAGWQAALAELTRSADEQRSAIRVVQGSAVNVVSAAADLPVTVVNELDQDVDVVVAVQPRNPRLVAERPVEVRVRAASTERVAVPVRAVANGNTDVVVRVLTPTGTPLGDSVAVPVRVRADWETRGMLVTGAVLVLVLVGGLTRTIRRGGRREDVGADDAGGSASAADERIPGS